MPIELKWSDKSVEFIGSGIVTGADCIDANRQVVSDPRLTQLTYQIVDLSRVEKFDVSVVETQILSEMDQLAAEMVAGVRVAMVCPEKLIYGMSKIYAGHNSSSWQISVFQTRSEAETWLKLV
jgi:hypothetical protein